MASLNQLWKDVRHDPASGFEHVSIAFYADDFEYESESERPTAIKLLADDRAKQMLTLRVGPWVHDDTSRSNYEDWIRALTKEPPLGLTELVLDDGGSPDSSRENRVGRLDDLLKTLHALTRLDVLGNAWIDDSVSAPALQALRIDAADTRVSQVLAKLQAPNLQSLDLHPGYDDKPIPGELVQSFFSRSHPRLRALSLGRVGASPSIFRELAGTPLLRQLEELCLHCDWEENLDDPTEDAAPLLEVVGSYKHLKKFVTDPGIAAHEVLKNEIPAIEGRFN